MIYSRTDSILQVVVDHVNNIQKTKDIYSLSDYEKNAVLFADFDYKLKHDRLREWIEEIGDCYPAFDVSSLYDFICDSTYQKKDEFLNIIDGIHNVKYAVHNLNYSSWYDEDKEVRLKSLKKYEQQYLDIEKDWNQYLENYLLDNIPNEYLSIITQKDIPKGI